MTATTTPITRPKLLLEETDARPVIDDVGHDILADLPRILSQMPWTLLQLPMVVGAYCEAHLRGCNPIQLFQDNPHGFMNYFLPALNDNELARLAHRVAHAHDLPKVTLLEWSEKARVAGDYEWAARCIALAQETPN